MPIAAPAPAASRQRPYVLLSPGPVNTSEAVRAAMAGPEICHRQSEACDLVDGIRTLLREVFSLPSDWSSVLMAGSGTAAVEAMLLQGAADDACLVVVQNGTYGTRMVAMARAHGITTHVLTGAGDASVPLERLEATLARIPRPGCVAMVHHETTTGLRCDVEAVARLCHSQGWTLLVDSVSGLGAEKLALDTPGLGMVACSANKCIQGVPGAAFVLGRRALLAAEGRTRSIFLHLPTYLQKQDARDTPYTLPMPCLRALHVALGELRQESVAGRNRRYMTCAKRVRMGLQAHGFELVVPPGLRGCSVTCAYVPPPWQFAQLAARLQREGFIIYDGVPLRGRATFRIANMGQLALTDLDRCVALLGTLVQGAA